jgi:hypothetical protein
MGAHFPSVITTIMVFSYKIFTFHDVNTCAHTFLVLSQQ